MATTIPEPPKLKPGRPPGPPTFGGGAEGVIPRSGGSLALDDSSPASRTGVWVGLAAISMMFAAFTSAMVVRQASQDWRHIDLPTILYLNTALLLASSCTIEVARSRFASASGKRSSVLLWMGVTLGLGIAFVAGQYAAWLQLRAEGLYLATNPSSSFLYLFTAAHALHVLGGLAGLMLVIYRLARRVPNLRGSTLSTVAYYWHFMDLLWIYLLLLLRIRL